MSAAAASVGAWVEPTPGVRVGGEIDIATIGAVTTALYEIADTVPPGAALIVDAGAVRFMSAAAVNLLIALEERLNERGAELVIAQPSHAVRAVLAASHGVRLRDLIGLRAAPPTRRTDLDHAAENLLGTS